MEKLDIGHHGRARRILRFLKGAGLFVLALVLVPGAFLLGYGMRATGTGEPEVGEMESGARPEVWTCSMHPQIRQPKPGKCPICAMDLIPVAGEGQEETADRTIVIGKAVRELMRIETSPVGRRFVEHEIRMVGKVDYDETRLAYVTAWVPGRLDRLYVDYTGVEVRKGDHMVSIYSPEILAAQNDLRRAAEAYSRVGTTGPDVLRQTAEAAVKAARDKLRRWGLTDAQISNAEKKGISSDHVTVYAPIAGTVVQRMGQEGMYVEMGSKIYAIADLSTVWVKLDAYESDLAWLHYGQHVTFMTQAYPGETFHGRISFIDPVLDGRTRTVKVRVIVGNDDGRLKPEMFVRANVRAQVASGGRVMDPELAGKWISPMHPEIVKDGPGTCDVCGMPLVKAEDLGYVSLEATSTDMPLVIPARAPLITGTRAVVYVETPGTDKPTYEGREIVLGPRAGDYYIVDEGLREGELVVVNGSFKLDSALQILAKPSMMNPAGEDVPTTHAGHAAHMPHQPGQPSMDLSSHPAEHRVAAPPEFQKQLRALCEVHARLSEQLASDDLDATLAAAKDMSAALDKVDGTLLGEKTAATSWTRSRATITGALGELRKAEDLKTARAQLGPLTAAIVDAAQSHGIGSGPPLFRAHCPMAFDGTGGDWLQSGKDVRNPYYGPAMLSCGEILGTIGEAPDENTQTGETEDSSGGGA